MAMIINKAKTLNKKVINKIGQTKFADKFTNDFLDTTATKIGSLVTVLAAFVTTFMFSLLPLTQYQPLNWNIPEWMDNPVLETGSMVFLLAVLAMAIFTFVVAQCYSISDPVEEVEFAEYE